MRHALLEATPTYYGAKGKLAPLIFEEIRKAGCPPGRDHHLVDAFMGAGSISLFGKALGYKVTANDISYRSWALGEAYIANDRVTLSRQETAAALETDPAGWYLPPVDLFPFTDEARDLFARMSRAASLASPAKAALLRAVTFKAISLMAFYLQVRSTAGQRTRERRYDEMTPSQQKRAEQWFTRPRKALLRATDNTQPAVFPNGHKNAMHRMDVIDFLGQVEGDVVYLDPPYPGTMGYEDQFAAIDALLEGREDPVARSRFSDADGWHFLEDVLDAAEKFPVWVLSLGSGHVTLPELEDLMLKRGRNVSARSVDYKHVASLSSEEKKATNQEFVLVGTKASVLA